MDDELTRQPASSLAALIRERRASSVEVVEAHLRRIEALNPRLHAIVQLDAEGAVAAARAADERFARGDDVGPLHGVPFTAKDWLETEGLICAAGFAERKEYRPKRDATVVARLRAAGAVLLGKANVNDGAPLYERPNNPYDVARTPGDSSSGDAVAVAASMSPLGIGSDSGGSLRWPAHCSGVATIKATNGLVPLTGHFPRIGALSDPRTVIGPLARSVDDIELALRVIAGPDGVDPSVAPVPLRGSREVELRGVRVARYTEMPGASPTPGIARAVDDACTALVAGGCIAVEATPPRLDESLPITEAYWARPESASWGEWNAGRTSTLSADEVERSIFAWERFQRSMLAFFGDYDAVVCPAAAGAAPRHEGALARDLFLYTLPYSLTGNPVVVVRAATSPEGLPLGVQIVARRWREDVALALARPVERDLGGWRPPA